MASTSTDMNDNSDTPIPTNTNALASSINGSSNHSIAMPVSNCSTYKGPTTTAVNSDKGLLQQDMKTLKKTVNLEEAEKLSYEIYRYSSFSTNYVPEWVYTSTKCRTIKTRNFS